MKYSTRINILDHAVRIWQIPFVLQTRIFPQEISGKVANNPFSSECYCLWKEMARNKMI